MNTEIVKPRVCIPHDSTLYSIWCEWDIGQEGLIFSKAVFAKERAKELFETQFDDDPDMDFDECWEELIGTEHAIFVK